MEGICPQCGQHYYGWSLDNPERQKCGKCGARLQIIRDGVVAPEGRHPLHEKSVVKILQLPPI